jgi:hypothetical protein
MVAAGLRDHPWMQMLALASCQACPTVGAQMAAAVLGRRPARLVGAISVLASQPDPYRFRRVAGTSAAPDHQPDTC